MLLVQDIMTTGVRTITEDMDAEMAWHQLQLNGIHHLVVLSGREVVGVISERDLGGPHGQSVCQGRVVGELMTPHAIFVAPDTTIKETAQIMKGASIGCLPVMEEDKLVGIVTLSDLLDLIAGGAGHPSANQSAKIQIKMA
jgi:CBS domain-containing protein